jgi:outer membrane protein assembly factor BamA
MLRAVVFLCASAVSLLGWNPQEEINVNSRYTVESVNVSGKHASALNLGLRKELDAVVGQKLDNGLLDRLAGKIRRDLHVQSVTVRVRRGQVPDHVSVEFEIEDGRRKNFDVDVPKFAYHSRQGWTGAAQAATNIGKTSLSFGVLSDGDELAERYSGIRARVEHSGLGSNRVRLGFGFDSYHQQWNRSALEADPGGGGLYRTRQNLEPTATIILAEPLTWVFGASFERLEMQLPAARTESSNSVINTLRLHRGWEDGESTRQSLDAGYSLRAATRVLGSDFVYVRHRADARYEIVSGNSGLTIDFAAGRVYGRAPLFERFILGNASTLRGYSKFDLDPLGADRFVHGSVDYRYRFVTVFYDAGALWVASTGSGPKQSAGIGFRTDGREGFLLAVAFPLKGGRWDPVFITGFNF